MMKFAIIVSNSGVKLVFCSFWLDPIPKVFGTSKAGPKGCESLTAGPEESGRHNFPQGIPRGNGPILTETV